jgi:hypothetical protein
VATPVNWKNGEDVIIAGSVTDDDAKKQYPQGWKSPKPYLRIVPLLREKLTQSPQNRLIVSQRRKRFVFSQNWGSNPSSL